MEYNPPKLFYKVVARQRFDESKAADIFKENPFIDYIPTYLDLIYTTDSGKDGKVILNNVGEKQNQYEWDSKSCLIISDDLFEKYFDVEKYIDGSTEFLARLNLEQFDILLKLIGDYSTKINNSPKQDSIVTEVLEEKIDVLKKFQKEFIHWFEDRGIEYAISKNPLVKKKEEIKGNLLRWDGATWTINFRGEEGTVNDTIGMHIIAHLIKCQGDIIRANSLYDDIVSNTGSKDVVRSGMKNVQIEEQEGISIVSDPEDLGLYADKKTIGRVVENRKTLEHQLLEAETNHDVPMINEIEKKLKQADRYLSLVTDKKGNPRKIPNRAEKCRRANYNNVNTAKNHIKNKHPDLFNHLNKNLKIRLDSYYKPSVPVKWTVEI